MRSQLEGGLAARRRPFEDVEPGAYETDESGGEDGFNDVLDGYNHIFGWASDDDGWGSDDDDDDLFDNLELPASPFGSMRRRPFKRARKEKSMLFPLPDGTHLKGNSEDQAAANPPLFKAHPLREEQCRSLAWMISKENAQAGLRGGLLADKMGYGKTSTAIGLISLPSQGRAQTCPRGYIRAKGTLIICPPRLVQQWEDEFVKFLGNEVAVWHLGEKGERPVEKKKAAGSGQAKLKLLVLASNVKGKTTDRYTIKLPRGITVDDFSSKFDIVLASCSIQANTNYYKKSIDIACSISGKATKGQLMEKRMASLRSAITANQGMVVDAFKKSTSDQFPAFEMFWWKRLILDEFHESESWEYRVREMMKSVGATHRWGLSGTPPLGSCDAVSQVAELLWFPKLEEAPQMAKLVVLQKPNCPKDDVESFKKQKNVQRVLQDEVRRFLDGCVRQNSSEVVEAIGLEEHLELVHHIAEERLIYRQACHDNGIFDLAHDYGGVSMEVREALLLRCAHFSLDGEDGADASSAVQHLGKSKHERIKAVEQQLHLELQRSALFGVGKEAQAKLSALTGLHPDAAKSVGEIASASIEDLVAACRKEGLIFEIERYTAEGELRVHPEVKLQQPLKDMECYTNPQHRHAILHELAKHGNKSAAKILGDLHVCAQACRGPRGKAAKAALLLAVTDVANLVDAAHRSLQFYDAQLRGLSQGALEEECSICLEPMSDMKAVSLLPCSHYFHTSCVRRALQQQPRCPHCNSQVETRQLAAAMMEMQAPEEAAPPKETAPLPPALRAHGSKLNAVAERLRQIRNADAKAQAIVFVQWLGLESQVANALTAHGLPFVRPHGKNSMGDCMRRFQNGEGPWVLILSLERAASGLNLTAANHVLFVHPMNAATVSTAKDYEQQAIGRIRRVGQTRPVVHVWRFVTANTVEEHISNLHRGAA